MKECTPDVTFDEESLYVEVHTLVKNGKGY